MKASETLVAALSELRHRQSDANLAWAQSGLFGATYPALLVETYHYVRHSIPLLARACGLLVDRPGLQRYLVDHMAEEAGHEVWAIEDLEALGIARTDVTTSEPLAATIRLVATQFYLIEHVSPVSILGYIYALESMPPDPNFLAALADAYAIPSTAIRFLHGHGSADLIHHREVLEMVDAQVGSAFELRAVVRAAVMAVENLDAIFSTLKRGDFVEVLPATVMRPAPIVNGLMTSK